ncbi:hypothetical protein ACHAWX_000728 [Stephanocyclus meneghinianus]
MLVAQLRRRDHGIDESIHEQTSSTRATTEGCAATPSAPSLSDLQASLPINNDADDVDIDDVPASHSNQSTYFSQRIQNVFTRTITWYYSQSDDTKNLIKVSFCFMLLYIAMGGRFGLEYAVGKRSAQLGNYGSGNAYDRYRGERRATERTSSSSGYNHRQSSSMNQRYYDMYDADDSHGRRAGDTSHSDHQYSSKTHSSSSEGNLYNDRSNPQNGQFYSRYNNDEEYYYERPRPNRNTSFHLPNLFDGSLPSMAILFAIAMACHRYGINPFHIFWVLNIAQNRGRVHGPRRIYPVGRGVYGGFRYGGRGNWFGHQGGYY